MIITFPVPRDSNIYYSRGEKTAITSKSFAGSQEEGNNQQRGGERGEPGTERGRNDDGQKFDSWDSQTE